MGNELPVKLEELCPICPEPKEFTKQEIPDKICDCPEPKKEWRPPVPEISHKEVSIDCYRTMIFNMNNKFFCKDPPKACE